MTGKAETQKVSQGARELAEKLRPLQFSSVPWEMAHLIDGELRELLNSLAKMIGWVSYSEECDPWYFSAEQAPDYEVNRKAAIDILERWQVKV